MPLGCGGSDSDLPVQTIDFKSDGNGFIQYYTNDSSKLDKGIYDTTNTNQTPMKTLETQVKKISGKPRWGYGVIFCFQDTDNFYRLLIHENGRYQIAKKVGGKYLEPLIKSWTDSSALYTGYNVVNTIKVTYVPDYSFNIYFNGTLATTFTDNDVTKFSGGDYGFYVSVGKDENFPNNPVDVRFKQITPAFSITNNNLKSIITEKLHN